MLLIFSSYIPVLILKSQRLKFSHTNNFSQINKFFVIRVPEIKIPILHAKMTTPYESSSLQPSSQWHFVSVHVSVYMYVALIILKLCVYVWVVRLTNWKHNGQSHVDSWSFIDLSCWLNCLKQYTLHINCLKQYTLHIKVRLPVLLCAVKTVEGDFRFCWTITPNIGQTHKENPNLVRILYMVCTLNDRYKQYNKLHEHWYTKISSICCVEDRNPPQNASDLYMKYWSYAEHCRPCTRLSGVNWWKQQQQK